jgi:hypothetical protein
MSRHTYLFVGSPDDADAVMRVIEAALAGSFVTEPGSDPYLRQDPIAVYVGGHEFDDDDIDFPDGSPVPLASQYPCLIDVRDVTRDNRRQEEVGARIFDALQAENRWKLVYIDDMQKVLRSHDPSLG